MPSKTPIVQVSIKRSPTAPLTVIDDFEVGTVAPSFVTSHAPYPVSDRRPRQQSLVRSSIRSEHVYETPAISQLNAALVPLSAF